MLYQLYQTHTDLLAPWRALARVTEASTRLWSLGGAGSAWTAPIRAACGLFADVAVTHRRPEFGIRTTTIGGETLAVTEEVADATPFATLLRFRKAGAPPQTPVLLVAPMSGHFATLLRPTVISMLPDYDVYITDWTNARDIPPAAGRFDLDSFTAHLMRFQRVLGAGGHMVAVCQPAVAALAATAVMAEANDPARPRSLTLIAGPIDTRVNPTQVNRLARARSLHWFERHLTARVPWPHAGAGRRVYPGFVQLAAFISMNPHRHIDAHLAQFRALVGDDTGFVAAHRRFYNEYGAVMDLPAEFYLDTVRRVFQDHDLPLGRLTWQGRALRLEAIHDTALLTVEGERDDICAVGQTSAALDLCVSIPAARKAAYVQDGAGHYGVFGGSRWNRAIYPRVRAMIDSA
jgi:poly(3-hydroxybutyrate) depolymerase